MANKDATRIAFVIVALAWSLYLILAGDGKYAWVTLGAAARVAGNIGEGPDDAEVVEEV